MSSLLRRITDWITFRDLPANQPIELRSLGPSVPSWQIERPTWLLSNPERAFTEGYGKLAIIYACVQARARAISAAPVRVYREGPSGITPLSDHPLRHLIAQPNPFMSEAEFFSYVSTVADIASFCVIEKERARAGNVIGLWPLRSDWLKPIVRGDSAVDWEYAVPGKQPVRLLAEDCMVYTPAPHPLGDPTGYGPMAAIWREAGVQNQMTDYVKLFFERGALARYGLVFHEDARPPDQATLDAMMEAWEQKHGGLARAARPIGLVNVSDIKKLDSTFDEMAYPALRNLTDANIAMAFGVPPGMIGAQVGLEHNTLNNAQQQERTFYRNTVLPLWTRLDGMLTRALLPELAPERGTQLEFDTSEIEALQADLLPKWDRVNAAVLAGWLPVNHALRELGFAPIPGQDVFLRNFSVVEVPAATSTRARVVDVSRPAALPEPRYVTRDGRTYLNERALSAEERAAQDRYAATSRRTMGQLTDALAPEVEAFFAAQRDRMITLYTGLAGRARELRADEFGGEWLSEDAYLREIFMQWGELVGEAACASASQALGTTISWDLSNPYLRELLDVLAERVVGINETTRTAIEEVVREALIEGDTIDGIAGKLKGLFDESYKNRHITIARTESQVGYNIASQKAYQASGVVERCQLFDNQKHDTEPGDDGLTCAQRNGLVVALGELDTHIYAEHPNGTMAVAAVIEGLGEE